MAPLSAAKALAAADIISPVPEDIDIAQAVAPAHIAAIAESLGLGEEEYDLYGRHKAKARALRRWPLAAAAPGSSPPSPFARPSPPSSAASWKCEEACEAPPRRCHSP